MCGTGSIGQKAVVTPVTGTSTNTTQVAGLSGGGDAMASIAPMLQQIQQAIAALTQALQGSGLVGGTDGGGATGCDMMGGGAGGNSTAVDDANGGAAAVDTSGGGAGGRTVADLVAEADAYTNNTSGGPGGKSDVAGDNDPGKIAQTTPEQTAVQQAQGKVDSTKAEVTKTEEAKKTADAAVETAKGKVTEAEAAVTAARTKSVDADKALVDAAAAVTAARTGNGEHVAGDSDTLESIATKYGVSVDTLKSLNPSITVLGTLPKDTKVKLPAGVGTDALVAAAEAKVVEARAAADAARRALDEAIAALAAAREALRQAEAAAERAKKAAEDALKAAEEAQKALDTAQAAEAAKTTEATETTETSTTPDAAADRMARLKSEAAAAQGDEAKMAVFQRIAAEPGVTQTEKEALLKELLPLLSEKGRTDLNNFFGAIAANQAHDANKAKMLEELAANASKSYDERNTIFQRYFTAETDEARKRDLFTAFVGTLSAEERAGIERFFAALANPNQGRGGESSSGGSRSSGNGRTDNAGNGRTDNAGSGSGANAGPTEAELAAFYTEVARQAAQDYVSGAVSVTARPYGPTGNKNRIQFGIKIDGGTRYYYVDKPASGSVATSGNALFQHNGVMYSAQFNLRANASGSGVSYDITGVTRYQG